MISTRDTDTAQGSGDPAIGRYVEANGIRTNYLEAGSGDRTIVFVHGSGPGVTAYANWRGVLPVLGEDFRCVAPDMVGFGCSGREDQVIPLETSLTLLQLLDTPICRCSPTAGTGR